MPDISLSLPPHVINWLRQSGDDMGDTITDLVEARIERESYDGKITRSIAKAARLAAMIQAKESGLLEGCTLQQLANILGVAHRSTILRDMRLLDDVILARDHLITELHKTAP